MRCSDCGIEYPENMFEAGFETCFDCRLRYAESKNSRDSGNINHSVDIHTHYDNLKVARNAPIEVIRAAYKTLSQIHHPDMNPNSLEAERVMKIINAAYEVLSDPEKRRDHDIWIARQEFTSAPTEKKRSGTNQPSTNSTLPKISTTITAVASVVEHVFRNWIWYLIGSFALFSSFDKTITPPPPGPKPYETQPSEPVKPAYIKPVTAPNGESWPLKAAYIAGYKKLHSDGLSKVTVDNSQNDTEVHVKLVSLDGPKAYPVRQFYIPGYSSFTVNRVKSGSYDIRCRYLENGRLSRSESFVLKETEVDTGIKFSNMTMTLYKVKDGNMQSFDLAEDEF